MQRGSGRLGDKTAVIEEQDCHQSGLVTERASPESVPVTKRQVHLMCPDCNTIYAVLDGGELVIRSRHRGMVHENRIEIWKLVKLTSG